ncbi:hypothetical protein LIER_25943 [Lithospermum erythrorhizon]|uniref:Rapid ALkalinization Factor n=1 Tax=Lithospermum erythrorhizon TaxID=34254 RepID=A0AAV3RAM1_LITER
MASNHFNENAYFYISIAILSSILILADCITPSTASTVDCNGTIGDCNLDAGEEFLMESEESRRMLASNGKGTYAVLDKPPYCNEDVYGSCNKNTKKINKREPCTYANHCLR